MSLHERLARIATREYWLGQGRLPVHLVRLLHHPQMWRTSRQAVARGASIGVFFGILIPLGQIPAAALLSLPLRANLGVAVACTLVTNPATFPLVYGAAYRLGSRILAVPTRRSQERELHQAIRDVQDGEAPSSGTLSSIGKPIAVGLAVLASGGALLSYLGVMLLYQLAQLWRPVKAGKA